MCWGSIATVAEIHQNVQEQRTLSSLKGIHHWSSILCWSSDRTNEQTLFAIHYVTTLLTHALSPNVWYQSASELRICFFKRGATSEYIETQEVAIVNSPPHFQKSLVCLVLESVSPLQAGQMWIRTNTRTQSSCPLSNAPLKAVSINSYRWLFIYLSSFSGWCILCSLLFRLRFALFTPHSKITELGFKIS